jgi:hypothetical protein
MTLIKHSIDSNLNLRESELNPARLENGCQSTIKGSKKIPIQRVYMQKPIILKILFITRDIIEPISPIWIYPIINIRRCSAKKKIGQNVERHKS